MKPEKFILKRVKPKTRAKGWKPVTIKLDLYEQLMEISDTTGESICSIASYKQWEIKLHYLEQERKIQKLKA